MVSFSSDQPAYIELCFRPNVDLIVVVRRFISDFYLKVFPDPELTSRVVVATHELLENAVRYAKDGETRLRVQVLPGTPDRVRIETWNRAAPEQLERMKKIMAEMSLATDAFAYYQTLLRRNAKLDGSGLGLARIRAEAEMTLVCEVTGELLCVQAEAAVERKAP